MLHGATPAETCFAAPLHTHVSAKIFNLWQRLYVFTTQCSYCMALHCLQIKSNLNMFERRRCLLIIQVSSSTFSRLAYSIYDRPTLTVNHPRLHIRDFKMRRQQQRRERQRTIVLITEYNSCTLEYSEPATCSPSSSVIRRGKFTFGVL